MAIGNLSIGGVFDAFGEAEETFRCCDTDFGVRASGVNARRAVGEARRTIEDLAGQLNAFDEASDVARLNREGRVENPHVARIVRRGIEYYERTGGVFDVRQGEVEHRVKAYIRGEREDADATGAFGEGEFDVDGDVVTTEVTLDLNGLAKGYIVDRGAERLTSPVRRGFVDGGGDISSPTGAVGIESPYGDEKSLYVLDTDWNVATSGGYKRRRKDVDHIYNPTEGRTGSHNELVTVVARRDVMEADALATTLAALPADDAIDLADGWEGLEALVLAGGVFHRTGGFDAHLA